MIMASHKSGRQTGRLLCHRSVKKLASGPWEVFQEDTFVTSLISWSLSSAQVCLGVDASHDETGDVTSGPWEVVA